MVAVITTTGQMMVNLCQLERQGGKRYINTVHYCCFGCSRDLRIIHCQPFAAATSDGVHGENHHSVPKDVVPSPFIIAEIAKSNPYLNQALISDH